MILLLAIVGVFLVLFVGIGMSLAGIYSDTLMTIVFIVMVAIPVLWLLKQTGFFNKDDK